MPAQRLIVIGLTGGIGMGKSTAARILRGWGLPVHDADSAVHALLAPGGKAVRQVAKLLPAALTKAGGIDRKVLGQAVFSQPVLLTKLETILHPLVRRAELAFLRQARGAGAGCAILDIPLLFETGGDRRCDVTICVSAPAQAQLERVLKRRGMTLARFKAIRARQLPDIEKRRRADHVVRTDGSLAATRRQLRRIIDGLN